MALSCPSHPHLSTNRKAMGHRNSKQLNFHLNGLHCICGLHKGKDVAAVADTKGQSLHLPHTKFHEKHGELLKFKNHQVLQDGKGGLLDANNDLINKKVLTHLETAFGIGITLRRTRGCLQLTLVQRKQTACAAQGGNGLKKSACVFFLTVLHQITTRGWGRHRFQWKLASSWQRRSN